MNPGILPRAPAMATLFKISLLAVYLCLSLYGLHKLKTASFGINLPYAIGFMAYCAGFGIWLLILRLYPLSYAFPVAAGSLICGTQIVGFLMLKESFGPAKIAGSAMIIAGIVLLTMAEGTLDDG